MCEKATTKQQVEKIFLTIGISLDRNTCVTEYACKSKINNMIRKEGQKCSTKEQS